MTNKEFKTRPCKDYPQLYELYFEGGGEVPKVLSGKYTSPAEALKSGMIYIEMRDNKKEKNVNGTSKSQ